MHRSPCTAPYRPHAGFGGDEALYEDADPEQYDAGVDGAGASPWCCLALPLVDPTTREVGGR